MDQQQHQQRIDTHHHPMGGQAGQRGRDRRALSHRPRPVQPAGDHRIEHRPVDRPPGVVGTQRPRGEPPRQQQRDRDRNHGEKDDRRGAPVAGAEQEPRHQHEVGAEKRGNGPGRGGHRVHRHHLLTRHHVRQRRRQAGPDEPGQTVGEQRAQQQRQITGPHRQDRADRGDEHQPAHVGADQHQPPIPAIHQRAGERPQQRVRQEQDREGAGDGKRVGGPIRVEQQRPGQRRLEQPVPELTRHPHLQQPPEIRQRAHRAPGFDGCAGLHPGWNHRNRLPRLGLERWRGQGRANNSTNLRAPRSRLPWATIGRMP